MMKAKAASSDEKVNDSSSESSSEEGGVGINYPQKSANAKDVVTRVRGVGRSA